MFPNFQFNETELLAFALVLLRMSAFIFTWPVFSAFNVPAATKVLLGLTLAVLMFPVINRSGLSQGALETQIIWLAMRELMVGLCIGFISRTLFFAMSVGANLIATSMGLASAQMFNPATNEQATTVEQFYSIIAVLFFLSMQGHHMLLTGLVQSFDIVPISPVGIKLASLHECGVLVETVVVIGIKIAAPVIAVIFVVNVAMGIIGRAVPQINVLITSLPVNILAGLFVMFVTIPALLPEMEGYLQTSVEQLFIWLKTM